MEVSKNYYVMLLKMVKEKFSSKIDPLTSLIYKLWFKPWVADKAHGLGRKSRKFGPKYGGSLEGYL